ncbi:hypothetical protein ACFL1Q_01410 [Patescibacteria group bacterium]
MLKRLLVILVFVVCFSFSSNDAFAIYDPLKIPNNYFGIHIADTNDLEDAQRLVNSSGGDWGYVTFVITEAERDHGRWQKVFNQMRKLHLIPIVRIASKAKGDVWEKPQEAEINNWIAFLNSLNWVIKNRYVIISNEPNHAKEWGGKVDPEAYSSYLKEFSMKLKETSDDFFVLPAGLDASANNGKDTMDEALFLRKMLEANPDIFSYVDGWVSHSYPNPDFSGNVTDRGKGTVTTYDWELSCLRSLGIDKPLPVFITETGWRHTVGQEGDISSKLTYAFDYIWNDNRVVAVTPFILNYTHPPFDVFSWKRDEFSFYNFYFDMQKIEKIKGEPVQEVRGDILTILIQPVQLAGIEFSGAVLAKNIGQSIWNKDEVSLETTVGDISINSYSFSDVYPDDFAFIVFKAITPQAVGTYSSWVSLRYKGKDIGNSRSFEVVSFKPSAVQFAGIFDKISAYLKYFRGP